MENDKNKQTAPEASEALPDDALGEVTGGGQFTAPTPRTAPTAGSQFTLPTLTTAPPAEEMRAQMERRLHDQRGEWSCDNRDWSARGYSLEKPSCCPVCGNTVLWFTNEIYLT